MLPPEDPPSQHDTIPPLVATAAGAMTLKDASVVEYGDEEGSTGGGGRCRDGLRVGIRNMQRWEIISWNIEDVEVHH